jgi:hypothetical protein
MATQLGHRIQRAAKLCELVGRSLAPIVKESVPRRAPPLGVYVYSVERNDQGHYTFGTPCGPRLWQTDGEDFKYFVQRDLPGLNKEFWIGTTSDEVFRRLAEDVRPGGYSLQLSVLFRAPGVLVVPALDWARFQMETAYDTLPRLALPPHGRLVLEGPADGRIGAALAELSSCRQVTCSGRIWVFGERPLRDAVPNGGGTLRYWFRTDDSTLTFKQFTPKS